MPTDQKQQIDNPKGSNLNEWFDDFVSTLRAHELQLETDTASEGIKHIYDQLMTGNMEEVITMNKKMGIEYFVKKIITEYLQSLSKDKIPNKIAFDYNDSEVLVWAEIPDNSEEMERKLIMAEADISAKYHESGYDMSSTIVEASDCMKIPNHYRVLKKA